MRLFAHRLALSVGRVDVRRMLSEISADDLMEWVAYNEIEPFGEARADLRAGIVASTIANVNRPKNSRALRPGDFMPDFTPREPQTTESMVQVLKLAIALGGNRVVRA